MREARDRMVPLGAVMEMVGGLCSECQARIRKSFGNAPMKGNIWRDKMKGILEKVSGETGASIAEILSKSHLHVLVEARRRACVLAREYGMSYPEIGAALGRHHTSIMYLVKGKKNDLTPPAKGV